MSDWLAVWWPVVALAGICWGLTVLALAWEIYVAPLREDWS